MNTIPDKAKNTTRGGSFSAGQNTFGTGNRGGKYSSLGSYDKGNSGRRKGATEIHFNGKAPAIKKGSTAPAR